MMSGGFEEALDEAMSTRHRSKHRGRILFGRGGCVIEFHQTFQIERFVKTQRWGLTRKIPQKKRKKMYRKLLRWSMKPGWRARFSLRFFRGETGRKSGKGFESERGMLQGKM
jgi:hypothetical protein